MIVPHWRRVRDWAVSAYGPVTGNAVAATFAPKVKTTVDRGIARQMLAAMLPTERMVPLDLPEIDGPASQSIATKLVYRAARAGTITLGEALKWVELINARYDSWLRYKTSPAVTLTEGDVAG